MGKTKQAKSAEQPLELYQLAIRLPNATDADREYLDRLDAARLDGCPNGLIALICAGDARPTLAQQFDAIHELLPCGLTPAEIWKATGLGKRGYELALAFGELPANLRFGIQEGAISAAAARRLVKLSEDDQWAAAERFDANETLCAADLDEIRKATRATASTQLPAALFAPLEPERTPEAVLANIVRDLVREFPPERIYAAFTLAMEQHAPVAMPIPVVSVERK